MSEEKKSKDQFISVPPKILSLGLDTYEIACFLALLSHGGQNSKSMYPSIPRIMKLTGMSRDRTCKSLDVLRALNILNWDRGRTGKANTYIILGTGCWKKKRVVKNVDKSKSRVDKSKITSPPGGLPPSARRTTGSPPGGRQPDPFEPDPLNQGGAMKNIVDKIMKQAGKEKE